MDNPKHYISFEEREAVARYCADKIRAYWRGRGQVKVWIEKYNDPRLGPEWHIRSNLVNGLPKAG